MPVMISPEVCLRFIIGRGNGYLFHFTSVKNLSLIREMGGLCSMEELAEHGICPEETGGDQRIDPIDINWPYIFLNFTPATPMFHDLKRVRHLCMFVISPFAICENGVVFTRTNSSKKVTGKRVARIPGAEGLKHILWHAVTMPKIRSEKGKYAVQAEALVPGKIPLSQVVHVAFASEASKSEGFREWVSKTNKDCTSEEKSWAEEKFVADPRWFRDSPPFSFDVGPVYSVATWIRENPREKLPVFYRDEVGSVTLVAEVRKDSPAMEENRRGKNEKVGKSQIFPGTEDRTVWSSGDGKSLPPPERTIITGNMKTKIEYRMPMKEFGDGHGSVSFDMRDPLWGDSWVRWATINFEIRPPRSTTDMPRVSKIKHFPLQSRFRGALVLGAVGDALGWPTEFLKPNIKPRPGFALPIRDFVSWDKIVCGKWWGYRDMIGEGEYSDDTQLTLAVARSIIACGCLSSPHFSYAELPLWLQYERGGGRALKAAAKWLQQKQPDWQKNFFSQEKLDYRTAGGNGAAMRNLPISLALHTDENRLIQESTFQAIITHGHPRGILGTVLAAISTALVLNDDVKSPDQFIERLHGGLAHAYGEFEKDELPVGWRKAWDEPRQAGKDDFLTQLRDVKVEADEFLDKIPEFISKETREYYQKIGAFDRETKGSGTGTACSAIYLFLKSSDQPIEQLREAVNLLGSDTDTIASILGGLLGAKHGIEIVPPDLLGKIQDRKYLVETADRLCCIAAGDCSSEFFALGKDKAQAQISEWEDRYFRRMFSGEIGDGDEIAHPTLGRGKIIDVAERDVPQDGYFAKLIRVQFDRGQSCVFHSRIGPDGKLSASLNETPKGKRR